MSLVEYDESAETISSFDHNFKIDLVLTKFYTKILFKIFTKYYLVEKV